MAIEAGRLFIRKIAEWIERKESFIVESTLSGLSLRKWIQRATAAGYFVKIGFVYLDSAELCVERVSARVSRGGHHVPADEIVRRYHRSNRNFWEMYKGLSDQWKLYNNSGDPIVAVATGDKDDTIITDSERYKSWLEMVVQREMHNQTANRE